MLKFGNKLYLHKEDILSFEPRVRQIDIKYELENNMKFDEGVYIPTDPTLRSRAKTGILSQKSRSRTFTSKKDSSKRTSHHNVEEEEGKNEVFNQFGHSGLQEVQVDRGKTVTLDYNLIYALRRFGYPYEYTIRCMLTNEVNY